jgi:hypothetical protein
MTVFQSGAGRSVVATHSLALARAWLVRDHLMVTGMERQRAFFGY